MSGDAQLSAELDLSVESAQSAIDDLGSRLDATLTDAASSLDQALTDAVSSVPPVEIETTGINTITADIDSAVGAADTGVDVTATVDADTQPALDAIDQVITTAESTDATITVDADTSDAQAALDDLSASAEDSTGSLDAASASTGGLANNTALLGGLAGAATGQLSGVSTAAEGIGGAAAFGAGGALAFGGAIGLLFKSGVDTTGALQRFDTTLGDMAESVLQVHVGTLTGQLDELAVKLGTDDEAMRNATASNFQFAKVAGASGQEAATFATNVNALALRAVALKPSLGDAASVAEQMAIRLQRGGRFAAGFGISLTASEIAARAMDDTGKTLAADLTIYEKSAAAAAIATERYGNVLGSDVAKGADNAIIKNRSLKEELNNVIEAAGQQVVVPIFDAMEAAIPAVAGLVVPLTKLAVDTIPILTTALEVATPPLQLLADVVDEIPEPLVVAGGAAIIFAHGLDLMAASSTAAAAAGTANIGITSALGGAWTQLGGTMAKTAGVAAAGVAAYLLTTKALEDLTTSNSLLDEVMRKGAADAERQAAAFASMAPRQMVSAFDAITRSAGIAAGGISTANARLEAFVRIAEVSPEAAQKPIDQLGKTGVKTDLYGAALERQLSKQRDARQANEDAASSMAPLAAQYQTTTEKAIAYVTALQRQEQAQRDASNAITAAQGGQIGYEQSQLNALTAQDRLNEAVAKYGPESREAASAALEVQQANLSVAQAAITLAEQNKNLADLTNRESLPALEDMKNSLIHQRDLAGDASGALQIEIDKIQGIIDKVNNLPPSPPPIVITAETAQAEAALQRLIGFYSTLNEKEAEAAMELGITGAASGAQGLRAGDVRFVGEQGPELFVADRAGSILPHGSFSLPSAPGPTSIVDPSAVGRAFAAALPDQFGNVQVIVVGSFEEARRLLPDAAANDPRILTLGRR